MSYTPRVPGSRGVFVVLLWGLMALPLAGAWGQTRAAGKAAAATPLPTAISQLNPAQRAQLLAEYGKLPLRFEGNQGQAPRDVKFLARGYGYTLSLTNNQAILALSGRPSSLAGSRPGKSSENKAQSMGEFLSFLFSGFLLPSPDSPAPGLESPSPSVVRLQLLAANPRAEVVGVDELPGKSNYLLGNDPGKWHTGIPTFARVRYANVYPGVDLIYYGNQGRLEYDFVVAPGADPRAIALHVETGDWKLETGNSRLENRTSKIALAANGDLLIHTDGGEVRLHRPAVYQMEPTAESRPSVAATGDRPRTTGELNRPSTFENRQLLDGRYVLTADNRIQFEIPDYDKTRPLVIDPVLSYSTYLGGTEVDAGTRIAVDGSGNAYLVGLTGSPGAPVTSGAFQPNLKPGSCYGEGRTFQCPDILIGKLNPQGSAILYATYLGGTQEDVPLGLAVDSSGNALISGFTGSSDFPVTAGAVQHTYGGDGDAFVTKLNPNGTGLVYSTYLGGTKSDGAGGLAIDAAGNAYITGLTVSTDFPTSAAAFRTELTPGLCDVSGRGAGVPCPDAFVSKLDPNGSSLSYSTYLGGSSADAGLGIAVNGGNAYVSGITLSTDFPMQNAAQSTNTGSCDPVHPRPCADAFVAEVNATGSGVVYSTYLGGTNDDGAFAIAVDSLGAAYVTGMTLSTDLRVTNGAPQPAFSGGICGTGSNTFACPDAFVTKFTAAGAIAYNTYLGGTGYDWGFGIAVDGLGKAYVTGATGSLDFPTVSPLQSGFGGGSCSFTLQSRYYTLACPNAFLTVVEVTGTWSFSTYLGGAGGDIGLGVAVDVFQRAYLTGGTVSADFPTAGALQRTLGGDSDAFVAKIAWGVPLNGFAAVAFSPSSLSFPDQAAQTTSETKAVTVGSVGYAPLYVTSITASGDFAVTHTCPLAGAKSGCGTFPTGYIPFDSMYYISDPDAAGNRVLVGSMTLDAYNAIASLALPNAVDQTYCGLVELKMGLLVEAYVPTAAERAGDFSAFSVPLPDPQGGGVPFPGNIIPANRIPGVMAWRMSPAYVRETCPLSVTFKPSGAGDKTGAVTLADSAPGGSHSVALSGKGTDFTVAPASDSSATATVNAGQAATYKLAFTPGGFSGTLAITCAWVGTQPRGTECTVAPSSLTLDGSTTAQATVSVSTKARSQVAPRQLFKAPPLGRHTGWLVSLMLLVLVAAAAFMARRRPAWSFAVVLAGILLYAACGGGGSKPPSSNGTPAGTYSLAVTSTYTATSGEKLSHTQSLTLTVN